MLVSPILHCKTFEYDFRSGFLYAPNNLDIAWARQFILDSTMQIEMTEQMRWVLFTNDTLVVTGVTCKIKNLFRECKKSDYIQYHKDSNGRDLYGFIGYCIKRDSIRSNDGYIISLSELLEIYLQKIKIRWNELVSDGIKAQQTKYCEYAEQSFSSPVALHQKTQDLMQNINTSSEVGTPNKFVYGSSSSIDWSIYQTFMNIAVKTRSNISLCTNMPNKYLIANNAFQFSTCSTADSYWEGVGDDLNPKNSNFRRQQDLSTTMKHTGKNLRDIDILNNALKEEKRSSSKIERFLEGIAAKGNTYRRTGEGLFSTKQSDRDEEMICMTKQELKEIIESKINEKCNQCPYKR